MPLAPPQALPAADTPPTQTFGPEETVPVASPYDEGLLDKAKTQWQRGDWDSLALLQRDALEYHPDRAKLALLAAAAFGAGVLNAIAGGHPQVFAAVVIRLKSFYLSLFNHLALPGVHIQFKQGVRRRH